ncbi:MAG: mannose-1-phosphate guanylyltransferase [Phycisphaeraceae bacterium]|nr:mannose-1-phosphate guanylyltransferase [Phycisphaeraceae bacterium]MCB9847110.1 mannose-1-phosphate guanylyltransferase [Phycisphaeraceae bacterium]
MRHAMIMAGGAGTRLWPMSRQAMPKQLVPFIQGRSLLEISADRLEGIVPEDRRYICTNERYREPILSALPGFNSDRLIGEPALRDTVNAVGLAAGVINKRDPDAVFAVFTADHLIRPPDVFRRCVDTAFALAEENPARLVTFSIRPTFPATGYGYVQRSAPIDNHEGAFAVKRYVEKPDLETAQRYLDSGDFGWNSGMFVWRARTILDAIGAYLPESRAGLDRIAAAWDTPDQQRVLDEVYPTLPKTSVDYAVMEPASADDRFPVCTVLADVDWLDVGSWPAFADTIDPDKDGNRQSLIEGAQATLCDCRDTLVASSNPGHHVAVLGADNLIIVHTPEATLVMPRDHAERLKDLHAKIPDLLR